MEVSTVDVEPIKWGFGTAVKTMQEWQRWLGREVVVLTRTGVQLIHSVFLSVWGLAGSCFDFVRPILNGASNFVRSSGGVVSLTLTGALLLGYMSGQMTDNTTRLTFLGLSYLVFGFGLVYGCQMGVIPLLV